jgi:hypothetical protein
MFTNTILYQKIGKMIPYLKFQIFKIVFDVPNVKQMIIEMNTQNQLFQKGVDANGVPLMDIGGDYSFVTKDIKDFLGQPIDRITLKDTGDFYKSWTVRVMGSVIFIEANTIKDGDDLRSRWGNDILGLTEESKQKLINYAIGKYRQAILDKWATA